MNGFRKWLEDLDRQDRQDRQDLQVKGNSDPTIDWPAAKVGKNHQTLDGDSTITSPSSGRDTQDGLIARIVKILDPIDPHLIDRGTDGKVVARFSGSPAYTSPEEASKIVKARYEHEPDEVENLLKRCAEHFVWLEKPCMNLLKLWMKFRHMLHVRTDEGPNPVLYQVNLLRLKDCDKYFPMVDKEVQNSQESDEHATLINAWNVFYKAWGDLIPTLRHYLVTFEKNSPRR